MKSTSISDYKIGDTVRTRFLEEGTVTDIVSARYLEVKIDGAEILRVVVPAHGEVEKI